MLQKGAAIRHSLRETVYRGIGSPSCCRTLPARSRNGAYDFETVYDGREELQALQNTISDTVSSGIALRKGTAHLEITAAARELDADLIIISTHGRKGLTRKVFGSTTEKVVRYAPCPVLIVRECEREFVSDRSGSAAPK